jgi:hypothetical protein
MHSLDQPRNEMMASISAWAAAPADPVIPGDDVFPQVIPEEDGPPAVTVTAASRRDRLIDDITAQFSRYAPARLRIRQDIEAQLTGVPDTVAVSALEDWRADLLATRPGQAPGSIIDPDPTTKAATMLRARIDRQTARGVFAPDHGERLQ